MKEILFINDIDNNEECILTISDDDQDEKEILTIEDEDEDEDNNEKFKIIDNEICKYNEFIKNIFIKVRNIPELTNKIEVLSSIIDYLENIQKEMIDYINRKTFFDIKKEELEVIDSISDGIEILKKQASEEINKYIKTASHHTPSKFIYIVSPFIYGICRIIANAYIKYNKSLPDIINYLDNHFKFTDREKVEIYFILKDMGYYIQHSIIDGIDLPGTYYRR